MAEAIHISPELFQEFLEVMAGVDHLPPEKQRQLLVSYAEVKYRLRGGARCPVCHTPVRYVMPVYSIRIDGSERSYPCLCTRCFEGEKGLSSKVVVRLGPTSLVYDRDERERFALSLIKCAATG
ncbi:MAG TPA: hypothetical protein VGL89_14325 [Candidatus Koribacter sp.]|jgi:hypothetical protein